MTRHTATAVPFWTTTLVASTAALLLASWAQAAHAADEPNKPGNEQVVVPQVDRREVKVPKFPSKDFSIGAYGGTYATQNFGAALVAGMRLGYHVTEDVFVEGTLAQTKVKDDAFRQVLPGGVFPGGSDNLKYYNLSAGYNILPGEVFFGRNLAKATAIYLVGGIGSTSFNGQKRSTFDFGLGTRLMMSDRFAIQVDMRDHVFSLDLLGKRQSTQNLELTAGLTFYF